MATSKGRSGRGWSPGQPTLFRHWSFPVGPWTGAGMRATKVRAFSRWEPMGIFEATGKRLIEADKNPQEVA